MPAGSHCTLSGLRWGHSLCACVSHPLVSPWEEAGVGALRKGWDGEHNSTSQRTGAPNTGLLLLS